MSQAAAVAKNELADAAATLTRRRHNTDSKSAATSSRRHRARKGQPYLQAQVVHYRPRVSVLDKELTTVSYHGLVNFLLLLLSATLIRLAIENYMKYGILVSVPGATIEARDWLATATGMLAVAVSFLVALAVEKSAIPVCSGCSSAAASPIGVDAGEKRTILLHAANLLFVLVVPSYITYFYIFQPALGTMVMTLACIMFLKLYSLAATNFDLRRAYRLGDKQLNRDPLQRASLQRGRLVVDVRRTAASDSVRGSGGTDTEDSSIEDMVRTMIPPTTRASFSLNAQVLNDICVAGNDRIDAKADALPRPRLRVRATTASEVLRRVASTAEMDRHSPPTGVVDDGSLSDDGAAAKTLANKHGPYAGADLHMDVSGRPKRSAIHYAVAYPNNVSLANFGYFWLAPTLCYQPSYPRMAGPIRKAFVAKRVTELVILCVAMWIVIQQYAVPTLVGSVRAIDTRNPFWLSERVLKLSVISAAVWFLGFYAVFHSGLNALAEVLRFADRAFYLDWWNSVDLAAYWREWNLPIHYFCKRHIMMPLVSPPLSLPVGAGVLLTFLVSAVMHELLFGIPTHCLCGYSFVGMMAQIPLIQLTQWLVRWRGPESGLGNAVFWISFCIVGQPLGVVQYYYSWIKNNP
ncbi:hypothetical protein EV183_001755 [Coemansia sp. RSA 2336]|nr:hypothetical protein EV183_001755 [Coemansia sp. RSA 2336]